MKNWFKSLGKGTVAVIAMILLIVVIVLIQQITRMDWKLMMVITGTAFAFRWLSVYEKVNLKDDEVYYFDDPEAMSAEIRKTQAEAEKIELENEKLRKELKDD